jgi:hypothetical protein
MSCAPEGNFDMSLLFFRLKVVTTPLSITFSTKFSYLHSFNYRIGINLNLKQNYE